MRNLMALLMTCAPEDVSRIAGWWSVELPPARGAERAAVLGREMLRDASARRYWEVLEEDSRELFFRFAAAPEQRLSGAGLARDDPALRRLMESGALWAFEGDPREGGVPALSLPPAADPSLVMPPELCRLANRLRAELDAGDISGAPLHESLGRLGTGELEALAAHWGLAAEPGSYTRDELLESLLNRISGAATQRVVAEAPETARKVYEALVREGGRAGTVALGESLRLTGPQLRDAVSDLSDRLLALETFTGAWQLFTPLGPAHSLPGQGERIRAPAPAAAPERHVPGPRWGAAWDMINLLRALDLYEVPVAGDGELPEAFISRFESGLVTRPADPARNLRFLYSTALGLGLVSASGVSVKTAPRARQWVESGLESQSRRILDGWLEDGAPDEGQPLQGAAGYRHDAATLEAARRALVEHVSSCEPGVWYSLEGLVESIHEQHPYILRPQNRLVRDLGSTGARRALEDWGGTEGEWVRAVVCGPLAWMHIIEVVPEPQPVFTLTTDGAWLAGRAPRPPAETGPPRLSISEEGRVRVMAPDSRLLWALAGFARPTRSAGRPLYLIDRRSIARARSAGLSPGAVITLLHKHAENGVPPGLTGRINEWGRAPHRIKMAPTLLVTCETEGGADELMTSPIVRSHHPRRVDGTGVLLTLPNENMDEELRTLMRRLTRSGLFSDGKRPG